MEPTRFWFRPHDAQVQALASRLVTAGHKNVAISDGVVGFVPFEISEDPSWEFLNRWIESIEKHFVCEFVESA